MYPDFLGIGAQKSGTTWLHDNLAQHPQIWLPPVKELHYLDHRPPHLLRRLFGGAAHLSTARQHLFRCLLDRARGGADHEDLAWAARYCLGTRDDAWYGSLFPDIDGKITGEICPGYARIEAPGVAHIHSLMPRAKIIYLIRDPIERAWSSLAMHFRKDGLGDISEIPEGEIAARLDKPKTRRHAEYTRNLAAWEAHYPPAQIFIGFFDDLEREPRRLFKEICDFLEVDSRDAAIPDSVDQRRNPGRGEVVPAGVEATLAKLLAGEVRRLHERFANAHTERWLANTERLLREAP